MSDEVTAGMLQPCVAGCTMSAISRRDYAGDPAQAQRETLGQCWLALRFNSPAELCRHSAPWMSPLASHRSNAEIPAGVNARRDYNAEGRRLVEALGLQVGGNYNAMDAIWKESSTGGKIYVGNETAARGPASTLAEHGITHVVNCTDDMANFCEGACVPLNLLS